MPRSRSAPASGSKRTDKFFRKVIRILNSKKIEKILLVKRLWVYEKRKREYLCGMVETAESENRYIIYLSNDRAKHNSKDKIARTLLHEVLHIINMKKWECRILIEEKYWWYKFSDNQKNFLQTYIPKRVQKYKPSD